MHKDKNCVITDIRLVGLSRSNRGNHFSVMREVLYFSTGPESKQDVRSFFP
jgi:hypothetical protein